MALLAEVFLMVLGFLTTVAILLMLLHFIKHQKRGCKLWKASIDVNLQVLIFVSSIIFSIHSTIHRFYALIALHPPTFNPSWCITYSLGMLLYTVPKIAIYIFLILRLHRVFFASGLGVSVLKLKIFGVLTCLPLALNAAIGFHKTIRRTDYLLRDDYQHIIHDMNIRNFKQCADLDDLFETSAMLKYIGITLYLLAEVVYSITILRMFLSRVLLLSMTYEKLIERIEARRNKLGLPSLSSKLKSISNHSSRDHEIEKSKSQTAGSGGSQTPKSQSQIEEHNAKQSKTFLDLSIRTTNLLIMIICSNFLILIKFGLKVPTAILNIDVLCNCFSVYLSYDFALKYYTCLFQSCHHMCYGCCVSLCYGCCLNKGMASEQLAVKGSNKSDVVQSDSEGGMSGSGPEI
eukprot:280386_1